MSNSTTLLDVIQPNSANKEAVANALFDAASPAMLYGRHASTTSGLTWGYYGGQFGSNAIANGTVTLTASTTNYVQANPSTGVVTVNTSGFTGGYVQCYTIVTGTTTVTSYTDLRQSGSGSGGSSTLAGLSDVNVTEGGGIDGYSLVWVNSATKWEAVNVTAGSTTLHALTDVNVTEGPGIDGYSLVWVNSASKWEAVNISAGGGGTLAGLSDCSISSPTNGQVLTWNTSAGKWQNAAASAGGMDPFGYYLANNPTTSGFTLTQNTNLGGTAAISNLASGRGFVMTVPNNTTTADNTAFAQKAVPGGSSWALTALLLANMATVNSYSASGLTINDASGKYIFFGWGMANANLVSNLTHETWTFSGGTTSFNNRTQLDGACAAGTPMWLRITYASGGNLTFYTSSDGETWVQRYQTSATSWISTPVNCGLLCDSNGRSTGTTADEGSALTCFSYLQA